MTQVHKDPVCGMLVDPSLAAGRCTHGDRRYYFCDSGCLVAFQRDPQRYLGHGCETAPIGLGASSELRSRSGERSCPACGGRAPAAVPDGSPRLGDLTVEEFVTLVRASWRRRLGHHAYRREHSPQLIRAIAVFALLPASPVSGAALGEELLLEIARLRAEGLNRAHIHRELYHLARVVASVLGHSGLNPAELAPRIEAINERLAGADPTAC